MREFISHSPEETHALAAELLKSLPARAVIALHGDLGSGKTCFVQGLAEALGVTEPVTSPTFTLVNEYMGTRALTHVDLYRLSDPDEALAMGFEELVESDGITAVEWAERAEELLPAETLHLRFKTPEDGTTRVISITQG
ncbi:MAG: tRNA (adenosine(37)-N6)-threonylcarbamoyltransferase complex ATPase subunit type 1 TsaE [Verrucomicrobia bacterium]|jgi:tRNA threonylcarbamoyladenosine biosynthesis protein TsaE|nr:tRNA (adenosine(37)-N6)-threonylcarbamoyltransferase complex ATPase subunit type 1 TsaE [Verrucomicrobiota bacterium]MBT7067371.1 tRNA (adenosine(37)-N6)-threonylcarbamoyltransferase complex ATPase subunit type 1 TsaE [Verrucomicrobiota bacterium]MBT7700014.1 tRNA (adenosine(37)-N6)-threonylcarbamoyltransferase complex ATPase subunit type 1 TsaE [Verrucomicrobiota bacterium]